MKFNPDTHHRRSIRLKGYDYRQAGAYFVTIVVQGRICLLGEVANGEMQLSRYGSVARECWDAIPRHFPRVELDAFVIMPNHVHGIIVITHDEGDPAVEARQCRAPTDHATNLEQFGRPVPGSLPTIVRSYKSAVTKQIHALPDGAGIDVWQRNYYETIVRDERMLLAFRRYVEDNPARWDADQLHPDNPSKW